MTKYSPLYIAAYNGRKEVVEVLLKKFPDLASTLTVERWTPLHAASMNGHTAVFELLLKFPYPKTNLKTLREGDKVSKTPKIVLFFEKYFVKVSLSVFHWQSFLAWKIFAYRF